MKCRSVLLACWVMLSAAVAGLAQDVVISEIMYRPQVSGAGVEEEWIELHNRGATEVNLVGWRLIDGVEFTFTNQVMLPPGGYWVICADLQKFQARYPSVANVAGNWSGFLNNNGEDIELVDAWGQEVDRVEYATEGEWAIRRRGAVDQYGYRGWRWFAEHDGIGKSLELINPLLSNDEGQNWASSAPAGGTPGAENSVRASDVAPLILNLQQFPIVPRSSDAVTISAEFLDESPSNLVAQVWWRTGLNAFVPVDMLDDGEQNDGSAGDGIFGAILPQQLSGTVVEYFVQVRDSGGRIRTFPSPAIDELGNFVQAANALYQVDDSTYAGSQPFYRIIMTEAERQEFQNINRQSDAQMNMTFITIDAIETEIRHRCGVRIRGAGSRGRTPPNVRVNIPNDRKWKGVDQINLNTQYTHAQLAGSAVAKKAGLPVADARVVQVRINGANQASSVSPQFGSYVAVEVLDGTWAQNEFPLDGDGNVYRGSTGAHSADLNYLGDSPSAYISAGYSKESNTSENDWSDLINLTRVLNTTPATQYVAAVQQVVNVEEWMRYFGVLALMEYSETALGTGEGDDFSMYRGVIDPRFLLIAHDFDTVFGQGDTGGNVNEDIFLAADFDQPAVRNFLLHPEFVPLYYKELDRLLRTAFSPEEIFPLFDRLLTGFAPDGTINNMKTFVADRNNYVRSRIYTTLTVNTNLAVANGYFQAPSSSVSLSGRSHIIETRSVRVNGGLAGWDPVTGAWSATGVSLLPGVNRVLVQAFNSAGAEFQRLHVDVFYNAGTSNIVGNEIENSTTWTAAAGPYWITASLVIEPGVTLTIEPGTTVYVDPGLSIEVNGAGRLLAEGTPTRRIRFTRPPGSTGRWGEIFFINNTVESRLVNVDIEHSGSTGRTIDANNSILYLDGLTFANAVGTYCSIDNSSFIVRNSVFPSTTGAELFHGTAIQAAGYGIIESNVFGTTTGLNDIIDFTGGQRPGAILQILDNTFTGASDDVLDLDGSDAHVEGNVFLNVHQQTAGGDTASAVSGGADSGNTSEITIVRNFFFDCDHAVLAKDGNYYTIVNNTMVNMTRAAVNFDEPLRRDQGVTPGRGAFLEGNIIWHTRSNFANVYVEDPTFGTTELTLRRNLLSGADFTFGLGNLSSDPRFVNTNFASITAASIRRDFALSSDSPAMDAGPNGLDMGANVPAGASISGEPPPQTSLTSATLNINGPGITHYQYSFNEGPYSTETPVATPIALNGLTNGSYRIAVLGKNSAGVYQSTPASRAWIVQTNGGELRINEVLARNDSVFRIGTDFPDLVELFNSTAQAIDLSGMSMSDDLANRKKYTFPPGSTIAPGQYMTLYADNASGPGPWLGFALNQEGDGVYLFNVDGTVRDQVQFGLQLPNASIGRLQDGTWGLTRPTFGSANTPWLTAPPSVLKLNEWLALARVLHAADFVELFNSSPSPVALGGLYLTDSPQGAPFLHRIPDLSFISGLGFVAFTADGETNLGPAHLNFGLAADQGELALVAPDGSLIDWIIYGPQQPDVSEGRRPNGAGVIARISPPTPGSPNPGAAGTVTTTNITIGLLPMATGWRYNAAGQEPSGSWRDPGYDDSTWPSGSALLGNENCGCLPAPNLNTTLPLNDNTGSQIITYYFRKSFEVNTNTTGFRLVANLAIDDGAVVYLNGAEVLRVRLPTGTITYSSQANTTVNNAGIETFDVPGATLAAGTNVIAVEVHQGGLPSSDVVFGLSLDATKTITNFNANPIGLNEMMANNVTFTNNGVVTDWVEILNSGTNVVDLAGMSLSDDLEDARRWVFPAGTLVPPGAYLLVHCNGEAPASTNASGLLNTGFGLKANSGHLSLFDSPERGGGQLSSLAYGIQPEDFSLGRFPEGVGPWALALPTPGSANVPAALGSAANLKINEWLANPSGNDEDFFELFNPNPQPVALGGLYLTDNLNNRTQFRIQDLSFIGFGEQGFVRFIADGNVGAGADHVDFRLSAGGEALGLFNFASLPIDTLSFGRQENGVSEGRFPDGADVVTRFPGTPTPGGSNMRQLTEIVINEVLTHTDLPAKDAIELFNPTATSVDVSGWYLSDRRNDAKKFRIPNGTLIPAGGYLVFDEDDFNPVPGIYPSFALSSAEGEELYLFTADELGNLTGYRTGAKFGAAENGVPFGHYETSIGFEFPALSSLTLGAPNAYPRVGPVVINEIMYHPPDIGTNDNTGDEFIELVNIASVSVPLYDPAFPTNTWRLRDAVDFDFPTNVILAPGGILLIVSFDPSTNAAALAAFRSRYALSESVRILGPYDGRLANDSENVELYKPDAPEASGPDTGRVPYIEVDKVKYEDSYPWPSAADGNTNGVFTSLQRRVSNQFGNDPVNWLAGIATPGSATGTPVSPLPTINAHPQSQTVAEGASLSFSINAAGAPPLTFQWRFNGINIPGGPEALFLNDVQIENSGRYSVLVANAAGAVLSENAILTVQAAPRITKQPEHRAVQPGATAVLSVGAQGTPPLRYQWHFAGQDLNGETNPVLVVSNIQTDDEGDYTVTVSNDFGSVTSDPANVSISAAPFILTQPVGTNVFVGATASFRVVATGSQPLRYQWRFNNAPIPGATNPVLTLLDVQLSQAGNYNVRITNSAGGVLSTDAVLLVTVPPQVSILPTDPSASEAGGNTGTLTFLRSGSVSEPLTVFFSINGTAIPGSDYDISSSPITIPAGSSSAPLSIAPLNDSEREATETVVVTVMPAPEYGVSVVSGSATVTINDDDNLLPVVNITAPTDNARFSLPTNILITATATDSDGPIARVEFYYNLTNMIGEDLVPPYEVGWSNPPAGTHSVIAVAIDDVGGSAASGVVRLTFAAPGFADLFAQRGILGGFTNFITGVNSTFTREPGEPRHHHNGSGNGNKSAWLSWVAPASANVTMNTIGSTFDTVLVVYVNSPSSVQSLSNLVKVASSDDISNTSFQSELTFTAVAGTAYQIVVDGYNSSAFGNISFRMNQQNPSPVITSHPQRQTADPGATVTFSVTATSALPLQYQWRFNGNDILHATNATLVLTNVQPADAGAYSVLVRNSAGEALSTSAFLTLRAPPVILTPLADTVVNVGSNVLFSVAVNGSTPFSFQWRFNGAIIPGFSGATFLRSNIQYTNGGVYSVTVTNSAGSASSQAEVIVRPRLLASSGVTNGGFVLRYLGTPGKAYDVHATTNLVDWLGVGTVTNDAVATEYFDPGAHPSRSYRLRVLP